MGYALEFTRTGELAKAPSKSYAGDAGWDLYVSRSVTIPAHGFCDVHTDIAVALPRGMWGMLIGRSSTVRRHGLRVEMAVLDNGYRGELFIGVTNHNDEPVVIECGDRIAQLVLAEILPVWWQETTNLPASDRDSAGFGSSGR